LYATDEWYDTNVADDWSSQRRWAMRVLGEAEELAGIVQLLGADALAPRERVTFAVAQMIREDFLQQSAYDDVDAYCSLFKQYWMLRVLKRFDEVAVDRVEAGATVDDVTQADVVGEVGRMRLWQEDEVESRAGALIDRIETELVG
jgi:V/A-type H+-transporting ATPase subunit A